MEKESTKNGQKMSFHQSATTHTDGPSLQISLLPTVRLENSDRDRLRRPDRKVTGKVASPVSSRTIRRLCWVCLANEDDDLDQEWAKPCRCKGTSKWVHQLCLQRWIDEKQNGDSLSSVSCAQCTSTYVIVYPPSGPFFLILDFTEQLISEVCLLMTVALLVGSVYWTAVTCGGLTIIQVFGKDEAFRLMDDADPLTLLLGLPTIPIMLIVCKLIHWEEYVLRVCRHHWCMGPFIRTSNEDDSNSESSERSFTYVTSITRVLCGALLLPTFSSIIGNLLFHRISSPFQRTILGGVMFVAVKGVIKTYYKHQQYIRKLKRKIIDFDESGST
ncbi:MARCH5 (predicted) [Pycnogonum litorale]